MLSLRLTPMELSMMIRFCRDRHASFHALTTNSFDAASTLFGVLRPSASREAMASFTEKELFRRASRTSLETSLLLPDLVHALVGNAVVPVHITTAFASRSAPVSDAEQDPPAVDPPSAAVAAALVSSSRSASYNRILSSLPAKKSPTEATSRTMPFTLYVSERRSATSFPTFPEAPTTATVSPGRSAPSSSSTVPLLPPPG
mmetsp:Transcript_31938/g.77220  ORF Transcript_31938/g.77220 Transcript_31938/m.77220 type:complete len:202 (+) Transcript_31938:626-1231(+)